MAVYFEVIEKSEIDANLLKVRTRLAEYTGLYAALRELATGSIIRLAATRHKATRIQTSVTTHFHKKPMAGKRPATAWDRASETLFVWTEPKTGN